ncbi:hypothetical protein TNCV_2239491 [Trichonephila clavipes]|nr:hypothetical protein TNCV_2239491 [Trichonephila clavipes]
MRYASSVAFLIILSWFQIVRFIADSPRSELCSATLISLPRAAFTPRQSASSVRRLANQRFRLARDPVSG